MSQLGYDTSVKTRRPNFDTKTTVMPKKNQKKKLRQYLMTLKSLLYLFPIIQIYIFYGHNKIVLTNVDNPVYVISI